MTLAGYVNRRNQSQLPAVNIEFIYFGFKTSSIIVLRKLQIPIKDIVAIFKSENMAALIQAFVDKLESLDTEISALSELRQLVDDFLHKMLMSGIKKIFAITLLYEETEKRLARMHGRAGTEGSDQPGKQENRVRYI
jgi:hypothetical protein